MANPVCVNDRRNPGDLFQDWRGKFVRKVVFVDDDLGIEAGVARVAKDLQNPPFGPFFGGRIPGDLSQDDLIVLRSPGSFLGNADGLDEPLLIRNNPVTFVSFLIPADHPAVGPFQHLDNPRAASPAPLFFGEMKGHPVPMHQILDVPLGKKYIREAGIVRDEEAVPVPMGLHPTDDYILLGRKAVMPAVELYNLTLINQGPQSLAQFFPLGGVHISAWAISAGDAWPFWLEHIRIAAGKRGWKYAFFFA